MPGLKIEAIGRYLPSRIVTAADIADQLGVTEKWIVDRTGVAERRWVTDETPLDMALAATKDALVKASIDAEDIDLIVYASATPHQLIPDTSTLLQRELGLGESGTKTFSLHSTCLSFMTALDVASAFIATGRHQRILIASAEIGSAGIDKSEPESGALLGDMSTAVLVTADVEGTSSLRSLIQRTYGIGADLCRMEIGYARHPLRVPTTPQDYMFHMDGPEVFRMAHRLFPPIIEEAVANADMTLDDIDLVVPHQASLGAIRSIQRSLGIDDDRVVINIDKYGNCVAASLPGALYEAVEDGRLQRGNTVLLAGTGAGLSMAAAVLTW